MAYQFVPLHGWLLPPHRAARYASAGAVTIRVIGRGFLYGSGAQCFVCPAAHRDIRGRRPFLTIIGQRLPFQI
jgi:hypothetical protein